MGSASFHHAAQNRGTGGRGVCLYSARYSILDREGEFPLSNGCFLPQTVHSPKPDFVKPTNASDR